VSGRKCSFTVYFFTPGRKNADVKHDSAITSIGEYFLWIPINFLYVIQLTACSEWLYKKSNDKYINTRLPDSVFSRNQNNLFNRYPERFSAVRSYGHRNNYNDASFTATIRILHVTYRKFGMHDDFFVWGTVHKRRFAKYSSFGSLPLGFAC